jgi:hypothetical protein
MYVVGKGFFTYKEVKSGPRESIPVPADTPPVVKADRFKRFFDAVRSRKLEDVPMTPRDAHISCTHCHLGNIAFRAGRSLEFDAKTEKFKDNSMNHYLTREYRKGFEVPKIAGGAVANV